MEDRSIMETDSGNVDSSDEIGFVLRKPETSLPDYYEVWMDLACNLTRLIESRTLREVVQRMPELSLHHLNSYRARRLAHLALGMITMGYVWQDGPLAPAQVLPRNLAVPFWLLSQKLGLPPILVYADVILANWKLKDPKGQKKPAGVPILFIENTNLAACHHKHMHCRNIEPIFSFPGGETCSGFITVSLLVEKAASPGITGAIEVRQAVEISDLPGIKKGLDKVACALKAMKKTFEQMHAHVDPTTFHGTMRIFLSGWHDNPVIPDGLVYEGVSDKPVSLSGGSAAQSSSIQCFDALLCVQHHDETAAFLARMRAYMPAHHRRLIQCASGRLRDFIVSCSNSDLRQSYNSCIAALLDLRNYHINIVAKYVVVPANRAGGSCLALRGAGGSNIMCFLKTVRSNTQKALIVGPQKDVIN